MSAGSAACRCAHVMGEKLAQWPHVGIKLKLEMYIPLTPIPKGGTGDVSINGVTDRHWQTKLFDTWRVTG